VNPQGSDSGPLLCMDCLVRSAWSNPASVSRAGGFEGRAEVLAREECPLR
jgi:hypothetical protein